MAGARPARPRSTGMAAEGLRFTDGYSNSPVCSPTRFALITGRFQYRLRGGQRRADRQPPPRQRAAGPAARRTPRCPRCCATRATPRRWPASGTSAILPHFGPLKSGYEEFFGPMCGGLDYFTHRDSAGQHDLFEGEAEAHPVGLSHRPDLRARGGLRRTPARERSAVPPVRALHGAALAVGDARRRGPGQDAREDLPHRRRLDRDLPDA